jgi:hypothetical protein
MTDYTDPSTIDVAEVCANITHAYRVRGHRWTDALSWPNITVAALAAALAASESARERAEGDLAALQAACDAAVSDAATARAEAERLRAAVLTLHAKRTHTADGYTLQWCVECQQDWPCPTAAALSHTDETIVSSKRGTPAGFDASTDDTEAE